MDIIYRYDTFQAIEARRCSTIEDAIEALRQGNRRFVAMAERVQAEILGGGEKGPIVIPSNPLSLGFSLAPGQAPVQSPFGIVLGCSDARAPIELIFDHSHNELFVVRVAGNVLGTECLGSIEYGARNFVDSVRVVVVLGHTSCGAVGAAVDLYLDPDAYGAIAVTHSLRSIVDRISVVVRVADKALARRFGDGVSGQPGYKAALWQMTVFLNAALTAHDLARELKGTDDNQMDVVYGVYDMSSQRVEAAPGGEACFANAPRDSADFTRMADSLVATLSADKLAG